MDGISSQASLGAGDIGAKVAVLGLKLRKAMAHEIADADDSSQDAVLDDRQVARPLVGHARHHLRDIVSQ